MRASICCSQMSITVCHYHFKTLNVLLVGCNFCCCHHILLLPVTQAVQTQPSLAGFHYLQHSLPSHTGWEKVNFSTKPLHLGYNAARWEDAQFAPALEFYTYFKHNRESCGNLLQFLVLLLAWLTQLLSCSQCTGLPELFATDGCCIFVKQPLLNVSQCVSVKKLKVK